MLLFLSVHVYSLLLCIFLFSEWTNARWYLTTETAFSSLILWQGNWTTWTETCTRKQRESGSELATYQLNFQFSIKYSLEHISPCRKKGCDRKNNLYQSRQDFPKQSSKIQLRIRKTKPNKSFLICLLSRGGIYSQGQSERITDWDHSSDSQLSPFFCGTSNVAKLHQDFFLLKIAFNSLKTYECVLPNRKITRLLTERWVYPQFQLGED